MIYVGHLFRWQPEHPKMLIVARRWDYFWCRLWSDSSFDEMARMFHAMRGCKTWLWARDGNSVPYYLLTPEYRKRAIKFGAQIKDWDNPQLPPDKTPIFLKPQYLEKNHETIAHQQETERGSVSLLFTEEDVLKLAPLLRNTGKDARAPVVLHPQGDPNPPCQTPGEVPQRCDNVDGNLP